MSDTIFREEAIKKIAEHLGMPAENWMKIAEEWIKDVPSVELHWIPCSERLPRDDGEYLVTFQLLGYRPVEVCSFDDGVWDKGGYQKVLAWMPLPKAYEGRQNE